jgi:hypothetical protein
MNDIQVDYPTLVEIMTNELNSNQSQIIALKARLKVYDNALSEALNKISELEGKSKTPSRKKSVDTDSDAGTY